MTTTDDETWPSPGQRRGQLIAAELTYASRLTDALIDRVTTAITDYNATDLEPLLHGAGELLNSLRDLNDRVGQVFDRRLLLAATQPAKRGKWNLPESATLWSDDERHPLRDRHQRDRHVAADEDLKLPVNEIHRHALAYVCGLHGLDLGDQGVRDLLVLEVECASSEMQAVLSSHDLAPSRSGEASR